MMDYKNLSDEGLLDLLYTEEDRLPREAVDEFIRRGDKMVPFLSEIVSDQFSWTGDVPKWWAVVHAAYILGAIGTESAVIPLLRALRWADAFDCDWVPESLPAIFGRMGPAAIAPLKTMAAGQTNGCFVRSIAMEGLGLIAWRNPGTKKEIGAFIYSVFSDESNDLDVQQFAGNVLLDMGCAQYREPFWPSGGRKKSSNARIDSTSLISLMMTLRRRLRPAGRAWEITTGTGCRFMTRNRSGNARKGGKKRQGQRRRRGSRRSRQG